MGMIRYIGVAAIIFCLILPARTSAGNKVPAGRYLRAPAVTWQDGRISGEVQNVPVHGLVEDLLRSGGYVWSADGALQGQISVTFDALSPTEGLRKVLKSSDLDFVMIQADAGSPGAPGGVEFSLLTVYQASGKIRFKRTSAKAVPADPVRQTPPIPEYPASTEPNPQLPRARPVAPAITPPQNAAKGQARNIQPSPEELAEMDKELKVMLDEMLKEKKISAEEYRQLVKEMELKAE